MSMPRQDGSVVLDQPPQEDQVTDYDRQHMKAYLRLLDAAATDATPEQMAREIFGMDTVAEPERARRVAESHLARARWFSEHGYRLLADEK